MRSGVTSSKVKRDWSKIDKDIEKDLSKEKQGDPMNDLFRQIYSNGNEETRKAMIKSF
jgi:suppressor of G2 allele of SKP1